MAMAEIRIMPAFLIKYHKPSGKVETTKYNNLTEATRQRLIEEKRNQNPDIEIAAIGSQNEESLRKSHSRYFARETQPNKKHLQ